MIISKLNRHRFIWLGALICVMCSACAQPMENAPANSNYPQDLLPNSNVSEGCFVSENSHNYRLGPEDKLKIIVYKESDLSNVYAISETGTINMPLIGNVGLNGCDLEEAKNLIKSKYADGYLVDPNILLEVENYKPFYIMGEVKQPGRFDYVIDMNGVKAVALAGGFTYRANEKNIEIFRQSYQHQSGYQSYPLEAEVKPGDVIIVKESFF